jgi:tRNA (guanine-N7-)-methyltransferase
MTDPTLPHRPIRSFVRREGRMTEAQRHALVKLWPRYGVDPASTPPDLTVVFGRAAPLHLDIGFGNGETLLAMAAAHPHIDYLGIEVHRPGVGSLLRHLAAQGLGNVRVVSADAREVLLHMIPDAALAAVYLFFPDPWPKTRHHKRRLVQPAFATLVARKLAPGGVFHLATDWADYAEHMLAVLSHCADLENTIAAGGYAARGERPPSKYERRGVRLGHGVWDVVFRRRRA